MEILQLDLRELDAGSKSPRPPLQLCIELGFHFVQLLLLALNPPLRVGLKDGNLLLDWSDLVSHHAVDLSTGHPLCLRHSFSDHCLQAPRYCLVEIAGDGQFGRSNTAAHLGGHPQIFESRDDVEHNAFELIES